MSAPRDDVDEVDRLARVQLSCTIDSWGGSAVNRL